MPDLDFIPISRRIAHRRRQRQRRWVNICAVYVLLVMAGCAVLLAEEWIGHTASVEMELARTIDRIQLSSTQLSDMRRRAKEAEKTLTASQRVSTQPDWSILLAALASKTGEEIVLRRCRVRPSDPSAGAADVDAPSMLVQVSGYGRTQQSVSRFVLRLEAAGLFDQLRLIGARREPFLDGYAVAFEVNGTLGIGRVASND